MHRLLRRLGLRPGPPRGETPRLITGVNSDVLRGPLIGPSALVHFAGGETPMAVESPKTERGCPAYLGYAAIAVVGLIVVLVMTCRDGGPDRPGVAVPSTATRFGDLGTLQLPGGGGDVWLATTEEDWAPMLEVQDAAARGGPGSGEAMSPSGRGGAGGAYASGTRVRVTKTSSSSRFVEVLDGEDEGRSGWVQREFVLGAK